MIIYCIDPKKIRADGLAFFEKKYATWFKRVGSI